MPRRHVTAISETRIRQKVDANLDSTDIDEKWFVFYEHSIGHPSFICVYLNYFPFFPFFLFLLFLLFLFFILLLNRKLREIKLRSVVE